MTTPQEAKPYEFPAGLHWAKCYPAEGESAFVELWYGDDVWGQIDLYGVHQEAVGESRTQGAVVGLTLFDHPDGRWEFELGEVQAVLAEAKQWLLANERGRIPLGSDGEDLSAAGSALSKMANPERFGGDA